jgi:anaerobic selenocysteine-containing dehydrogenase
LFAEFRADPENHPLRTPSGRIEIYSDEIARFAYDDCPPHPAWIEPAEWLGGGQTTAFPLHLVSSQPRHRLHSQMDAGPVSARGKIAGRETLAINPVDARSRGIGDGEVVRVFNARGACFAGVSVTEAVRPASFGSPAAPGTTPRATRTSRPAPILPSSRQPSRDPAPQPAGYPDKADAAERFRPTLRWRGLDSNF